MIENIYIYRVLRRMSQDELALRMSLLDHGWTRSTVSAVEGRGRKVTVDELLGLSTTLGVTIGDLLDPTGPDGRRPLSLDVGLAGAPPISPRDGHRWAQCQAIVRFTEDEDPTIEVDASAPASAKPVR
ncbi:MAG: helix-turn-helix domain-containing protein [Actinomycetota bacterium]|nr:helix-turn-helix domain-containing protein [Actinomycetota bacterium]